MLIGFSKYGTGSAARPIDYLTAEMVHAGTKPGKASAAPVGYLTGKSGKKGVRREPSPVVVRGDPDRVKTIIDSIKFKNKYTSGVLSFSPNEIITPAMEETIIKEFEQTAFAGLRPDRFEVLWVRHQHTKTHRHELHFLTPRVDLVTGKSLNIAPPGKSTRELFDTLRSKINAEYGLSDPDDPARSRKTHVPDYSAKLQAAEQDDSKIDGLKASSGTPNPARAKLLVQQLQKRWNTGRLIIANAIRHRLPNQIPFHRFMTELEQHLLSAFQRLESQYQERDRLFADALNRLSKQLNDGAERIETLNSQVTVLNGQIERLQTILTKR